VRILQIVTLSSAGGAFGGPLTVAYEQCEALQSLGHDVTLLTGWDGIADAPPTSYRLVRHRAHNVVPVLGQSGLVSVPLLRWVRAHRDEFDVIHVHCGRDMVSLPAAAAVGARRPFVLQTHGMIMPDRRARARVVDALLTDRVLRRTSAVLYLTDVEHEGLRELGLPESKLRSLRNGIGYDPALVRDSAAAPFTITFCARLHRRKRVSAFLAMAALLTERDDTKYRFVVAGPDEGELEVVEQFRRDRPDVGVEYRGALSGGEARALLAAADVYVLPSVDEPFPMTVLEALAVGTPAVVTDSCGIADLLQEHDAAKVTDGSPEQLAAAVRSLLAEWPDASARSREVIRTNFSIESIASQLAAEYEAALVRR
jgi:glycosyltransferase involved in cell wall biosynthesis